MPSPLLADAPPAGTIPHPFAQSYRVDPRASDAPDWPWWVVHARARAEKSVARQLLADDVPYLLPLRVTTRITSSRNRVAVEMPVFPGYVFLGGCDECDAHNARRVKGVVGLIPVPASLVPRLVSDLCNLMAALESGAPLGHDRPLAPGARVRVAGGPLDGREGVLIREAHRDYLLVELAFLGRAVAVEVERWRVEPIEDDAP